MDLIDALTGALTVESLVIQSKSPLFRRRFSSGYDLLKQGRILIWHLRGVLDRDQLADAENTAGFEVYTVDCTDDAVPDAETLQDRVRSKKGGHAPT